MCRKIRFDGESKKKNLGTKQGHSPPRKPWPPAGPPAIVSLGLQGWTSLESRPRLNIRPRRILFDQGRGVETGEYEAWVSVGRRSAGLFAMLRPCLVVERFFFSIGCLVGCRKEYLDTNTKLIA
jgi:hypothetical protein